MVRTIAVALLMICLLGCATLKFTEQNVSIFTAKKFARNEGATGITDVLTREGTVFVVAIFKWNDTQRGGGPHRIESKWYSGDNLVWTKECSCFFDRPPYYVWFYAYTTSFGIGKARVEIFADGQFVGSKHFEVVAQ